MGSLSLVTMMRGAWLAVRHSVVVPALQVAVYLCAAMSLMLFVERLYMGLVVAGLWLRRRCNRRLNSAADEDDDKKLIMADSDDLESTGADRPMVLVQIPMFNEKQVYRLSIGAACGLWWPSEKLVIQVLDDSTDGSIRSLVQAECWRWASKGVHIQYENRSNRSGYKAGAMREGLKKHYARGCEFVAVFDADFQPDANFLRRTQEVGSACHAFFGFNGTAGVWRVQALADAGGWKDRTTVEDMDLAVRASLRGWRFVYVGDVQVRNELPSTFKAYRYQQHRWSCGPANLMRKMFREIVVSRQVSAWKKLHLLYGFFFVRKVVAHLVTFLFYCVVIPACVLVQGDVRLPKYVAMYVPAVITLLNAACTPRSWHLLVFWILFENVMSMHRSKATIIGLMEASRANEWVVTEKLGSSSTTVTATTTTAAAKGKKKRDQNQSFHAAEILMGLCMLYCAIYDIIFGHDHFYVYLLMQSAAAFIIGFGYVGTQ
ncbi:hypothetical protein BRADI_4g38970v3 [Brachypodium distachyon]|uniref:Glycosyltransferase 2-like domain-containing protein n=1 Tax=Brachypodium distachyon TaxID=15368 RepID=A0A0Q3LG06_BRADI|nr:hypothetical protein BRADI_4g38970v3 [Brachypodium distachyon]